MTAGAQLWDEWPTIPCFPFPASHTETLVGADLRGRHLPTHAEVGSPGLVVLAVPDGVHVLLHDAEVPAHALQFLQDLGQRFFSLGTMGNVPGLLCRDTPAQGPRAHFVI